VEPFCWFCCEFFHSSESVCPSFSLWFVTLLSRACSIDALLNGATMERLQRDINWNLKRAEAQAETLVAVGVL
jgi:hypothetical protein